MFLVSFKNCYTSTAISRQIKLSKQCTVCNIYFLDNKIKLRFLESGLLKQNANYLAELRVWFLQKFLLDNFFFCSRCGSFVKHKSLDSFSKLSKAPIKRARRYFSRPYRRLYRRPYRRRFALSKPNFLFFLQLVETSGNFFFTCYSIDRSSGRVRQVYGISGGVGLGNVRSKRSRHSDITLERICIKFLLTVRARVGKFFYKFRFSRPNRFSSRGRRVLNRSYRNVFIVFRSAFSHFLRMAYYRVFRMLRFRGRYIFRAGIAHNGCRKPARRRL